MYHQCVEPIGMSVTVNQTPKKPCQVLENCTSMSKTQELAYVPRVANMLLTQRLCWWYCLRAQQKNDVYTYATILQQCSTVCVFLRQPVNNADFIIPVEIDGTVHQVCI